MNRHKTWSSFLLQYFPTSFFCDIKKFSSFILNLKRNFPFSFIFRLSWWIFTAFYFFSDFLLCCRLFYVHEFSIHIRSCINIKKYMYEMKEIFIHICDFFMRLCAVKKVNSGKKVTCGWCIANYYIFFACNLLWGTLGFDHAECSWLLFSEFQSFLLPIALTFI